MNSNKKYLRSGQMVEVIGKVEGKPQLPITIPILLRLKKVIFHWFYTILKSVILYFHFLAENGTKT